MVEFKYEELVKATQNFSSSRLIGKGSHGSVYKGLLEEEKLVAVKKSLVSTSNPSSNDNFNKLNNEISILSTLNECPYIIKSIGTSPDMEGNCKEVSMKRQLLVMEYMPNGSLYDLIHNSSLPPSWEERVDIAIRIAKAIEVLHERNPLVIHRDIKSANVLFDSNWNAKLADFGLAILQSGSSGNLANDQPAGTIGYLDPSYTLPGKLGTKVDVFSFGVVLLEIFSGRKVIDVNKVPSSIVEWAIELVEMEKVMEIRDMRIELPKNMEGSFRNILYMAARCVSSKEDDRPCIGEIIMEMVTCNFVNIERVRSLPSWIGVMRSMILIRRERKLRKRWRGNNPVGEEYYDVIRSDQFGNGKFRGMLVGVALDLLNRLFRPPN